MQALVANQLGYSMDEFHTISLITILETIHTSKSQKTTEFAEKIQNRTKLLIDKTKQNIMHSYLKYKEYYDPLEEKDYCFVS